MGVQEFGDDGLKLGPITRAFAKLWIPLWFGQFRWSSAHHPAFATGLDQGGLGSLHFNAQNIKKWHSGKGNCSHWMASARKMCYIGSNG